MKGNAGVSGRRGPTSSARKLGRLLSLLALLPVFLTLAAPAHAAFPGENGKIAFSTNRTNPQNYARFIYTINPDGTTPTRISPPNTSQHLSPTWSADGRLLALTTDTNGVATVARMNPDGTGETPLSGGFSGVGGDRDPAWSPDGRRISYWSCGGMEEGCWGIFTVNSDSTPGPSCIPNVCFTGEGAAPTSWSPDGTKIAFGGLSVINVDGTRRQDLLTGGSQGYDPNWSPNGQKIAFTSTRDGNGEIYVMNADGSGQTNLTNNPSQDYYPAWSPDGTKIAFASLRDEPDPSNCFPTPYGCNWEVYVMNADGSGQTNLTNDPALDTDPDWQPLHLGYARPKGATQMTLRFVPAFEPCASANASHGAPFAVSSCSPPVPESAFLTVGTPDANGAAANSAGQANLRSICNPPAPGPVPPCTNTGDQGDEELRGKHHRRPPETDAARLLR